VRNVAVVFAAHRARGAAAPARRLSSSV
jgi:hypothetical protein